MSDYQGRPDCPICGDIDILIERRPDGDATCMECGYKGPYKEFLEPFIGGELVGQKPPTEAE